jgi:hypothetical protein
MKTVNAIALVLLALPATVEAQCNLSYTNNNTHPQTATVTGGCSDPCGELIIPDWTSNNLPVTSIADYAFRYCTSLTSVTIGTNVTSIGYVAFDRCPSLTNVIVSSSVTNIGGGAFQGCTSLSAITVDASNSFYSSVDGVLFDKSQTTLIQCPGGKTGSYTIPDSVASIGSDAFWKCIWLTNVTIGTNVTSIGAWAFADCISLISATIPNSVTSIGGWAFADCASLTSVTIGTNVTDIGVETFAGCTGLPSVAVPNSVTSIWDDAFLGCASLTSVTIGSGVTNIGNGAFMNCVKLTSVYFKGNAPSPSNDQSVFSGENAAATVYYLPETSGWTNLTDNLFDNVWVQLWNPQMQNPGVRTNQFGFTITNSYGLLVVVEACTNLAIPSWTSVGNNANAGGSSYFRDPQWTNYPARFYRLRSP